MGMAREADRGLHLVRLIQLELDLPEAPSA